MLKANDNTNQRLAVRRAETTFTDAQYAKHYESFWAMPATWSHWTGPNPPQLARMWSYGRSPLIAVLPVLGQVAHHPNAESWWQSIDELALLAGMTPTSIGRAISGLEHYRLASALGRSKRTPQPNGRVAMQWKITNEIAARRANHQFTQSFFPFRMCWVYGGAWSRMSGAQKALLLAVGGRSFTVGGNPEDSARVFKAIARLSDMDDMRACYEARGAIRIAQVSTRELVSISGVSRSTLISAIATCRRPGTWRSTTATSNWARRSPLAVYETKNGDSLLYHIREHAPPYEQFGWTAP